MSATQSRSGGRGEAALEEVGCEPQARDALASATDALVARLRVDARHAVGAPTLAVDLVGGAGQPGIARGRAEGGRFDLAQYPLGETSSTRHIVVTV